MTESEDLVRHALALNWTDFEDALRLAWAEKAEAEFLSEKCTYLYIVSIRTAPCCGLEGRPGSDLAEGGRVRELPHGIRRPSLLPGGSLSTPYENANLLMRLYDLRREAKLRDARNWVIRSFNPSSPEDVAAVFASEDSAKVRMVMGYWDMAAAFVVHGAIDAPMFHATCGEMLATHCKVEHMLAEVREHTGQTGLLGHVEQVAAEWPGAKERMAGMREYFAALADGAQ